MGGPAAMAFVSIHAAEIRMDTWRGSVSVLRFTLNFARGIVLVCKRQLGVEREQVTFCILPYHEASYRKKC